MAATFVNAFYELFAHALKKPGSEPPPPYGKQGYCSTSKCSNSGNVAAGILSCTRWPRISQWWLAGDGPGPG